MACERKRWRYPAFEASFVTLVRDIDFANIINSDGASHARRELENQLDALKGELATIHEKQSVAFELLAKKNIEFVSKQLEMLQKQSDETTTKIAAKEKELEALNRDAKTFDESREQIKPLLERLQTYEVRAEASQRLKSMVNTIYVAPVGWTKENGHS